MKRTSKEREIQMSKKLFVGGLSWGTSDEGLRAAFEQFGEVSDAKVITDRETGRSRGFGFVTFENGADADKAMDAMNGSELDGRTLNVKRGKRSRTRSSPLTVTGELLLACDATPGSVGTLVHKIPGSILPD